MNKLKWTLALWPALFAVLLAARPALAQGVLENPLTGAFKSGISVISGWKCSAGKITIGFDGNPPMEAAYGTGRADTAPICGDTNNGFGLLFNYNLLGNGKHTAHALDNGVEFASAEFNVITFGLQFLRGASGTFSLMPFPNRGRGVAVTWDEASQNFAISDRCGVGGDLCPVMPLGFPATGQTTSHAPGDDGATRAGVALSFTDNGDGTITDNATGLVWEKKSNDDSLHDKDTGFVWEPGVGSIWEWIGKVNAEGGTGFAGHDDWRIPNVKELASIVNYGVTSPLANAEFNKDCKGGCTTVSCSCIKSSGYWSSTTLPATTTTAYTVKFSDGKVSNTDKTTTAFVRAVRGGL